MPKAYSYSRFSSPEQASGDSFRRQMQRTIAWCERVGIELDSDLTFADHGRSGFRGSQFTEGALGRFVELVRSGTIACGSYLLIEDLDRFSRENPMTATSRLFDLARMGIVIVTTSDGMEYSEETLSGHNVGPLLMLVLKLSQSHMESARKSDIVGEAWAKKRALARKGEHKMTARCPGWLELSDGEFHEIKERVEVVRRIYRETIAGFGRRTIAQRLNNAVPYVPPFRSGEKRKKPPVGWQPSSIAKVLNNKAVFGEYQPGVGSKKFGNHRPDGEPIRDYYPRIISEDDFWTAQGASKSRLQNAAGRRGRDGAHILKNLGRCGSCGGPMHIVNKGKPPKGAVYLRCDVASRKAGCENERRWRVDHLECALLSALGFLEASAFAALDDAMPEAQRKVQARRAELETADAQRKRWKAVLDKIDDEMAIESYASAAAEYKRVSRELEAAEAQARKLAADPRLVDRLTSAASLSHQLEVAEDDKKLELRIRLSDILRGLVERIDCRMDIGAVMVLKPHLRPRRLDGTTPFAFRMHNGGVWTALIEKDADEEALDVFLGWNGGV